MQSLTLDVATYASSSLRHEALLLPRPKRAAARARISVKSRGRQSPILVLRL